MENGTSMAQAWEKTIEGKWEKVQIYTATHIYTGDVCLPLQHRLLDILNGVLFGDVHANKEFLPLSKVSVHSLGGGEATMQSAYINKAYILFIREVGEGETQGVGDQLRHKLYPFVPKQFTMVKVYVAPYTLAGRMHYGKGQQVLDVLNSALRFFPLTNVEITHVPGGSESGVSFIAVNRGQLLSLEELGTT